MASAIAVTREGAVPSIPYRAEVLEALESCFALDRVKTVVHGFTSLGLVEMTRRRTRPPLREVLKKHASTDEAAQSPEE